MPNDNNQAKAESLFLRAERDPSFLAAEMLKDADRLLTVYPVTTQYVSGQEMIISAEKKIKRPNIDNFKLLIARANTHVGPVGPYKIIKNGQFLAPIAQISSGGDPYVFKDNDQLMHNESFTVDELVELRESVAQLAERVGIDVSNEKQRVQAEQAAHRAKQLRMSRRIVATLSLAAAGIFGGPWAYHQIDHKIQERRAEDRAEQQAKLKRFDDRHLKLSNNALSSLIAGRAVYDERLNSVEVPYLSDEGARVGLAEGSVRAIDVPDETTCSKTTLPIDASKYDLRIVHDGAPDDVVTVGIDVNNIGGSVLKICNFGGLEDSNEDQVGGSSTASNVLISAAPHAG